MLKMKVCMLGAFAVGKTSLVQRYVNSIFSEKYQTTLGVKIDKKSVHVDAEDVELIIWDLAGEDEFMSVRSSYLRGSSGFILVADGARAETLDIAKQLKNKVFHEIGDIPFILIINKSDIEANWTINTHKLDELMESGWQVIKASARDDENVEYSFQQLTQKMIEKG